MFRNNSYRAEKQKFPRLGAGKPLPHRARPPRCGNRRPAGQCFRSAGRSPSRSPVRTRASSRRCIPSRPRACSARDASRCHVLRRLFFAPFFSPLFSRVFFFVLKVAIHDDCHRDKDEEHEEDDEYEARCKFKRCVHLPPASHLLLRISFRRNLDICCSISLHTIHTKHSFMYFLSIFHLPSIRELDAAVCLLQDYGVCPDKPSRRISASHLPKKRFSTFARNFLQLFS